MQTTTRSGHITKPNGSTVYYHYQGTGVPLVVCNGLGLEARLWQVFREFAHQHFAVLTWDYPGVGPSRESGYSPHDLSVGALTETLDSLREACGIDKALFLGHSIGAQLVRAYQARYPQHVLGTVFCAGLPGNPLSSLPRPEMAESVLCQADKLLRHYSRPIEGFWHLLVQSPVFPEIGRRVVGNPALLSPDRFELYRDNLARLDLRATNEMLKHFAHESDMSEYALHDTPLLIVGAEYDKIVPIAALRQAARSLPEAEFFAIRRGGHLVMLEEPVTLGLVLERFVRERINLGLNQTVASSPKQDRFFAVDDSNTNPTKPSAESA